jgi:aminoglycoside phosphotransferase (APT) family kinase protein
MRGVIVNVQERLPGNIAGTATIVDTSIIYTWLQDKATLMPQIQRMLGEIHSIPVSGFGLPIEKSGKFMGTSATWQECLLEKMSLWLDGLKPGRSLRALEKNLHSDIDAYAKQFHLVDPVCNKGSLVHGDMGNPSNVLGDQEVVTGIIDWEFALIGDPAWEFCDEGWVETIRETQLDSYFQACNIGIEKQRQAFLRRILLYRPLQCLMWLYVHRNDEDPVIFDTCVALLRKDIVEAQETK